MSQRIFVSVTGTYIIELYIYTESLNFISYTFCLYFILNLHVWIRIRIGNMDPDPQSSWIWIRIHNTSQNPNITIFRLGQLQF